MPNIIIHGAAEGNLKNISLEIPRNKLVVFTGLSGSGKSTLAVDVLFQECQRQYLESMGLQGIQKPNLDSIRNASPAIMITQSGSNKNTRSTVGTLTDIYTDLRMVYEKLGVRSCPQCHATISSAECKEEVVKSNGEFTVFMYCSHCGSRMEKLTRTHFSHNTREGACEACEGLGRVLRVSKERAVDESLSLEAGAVPFWEKKYKDYQISAFLCALRHYGRPCGADVTVADFDEFQKFILYYGVENEEIKKRCPGIKPPETVESGKFEGVVPMLWRRISQKGGDAKRFNTYFDSEPCPDCVGERLGKLSRSVTVKGVRIAELSKLSLEELYGWLQSLEKKLNDRERPFVQAYLQDLKIQRIVKVGLGYLSLNRQTITLSGGERQRLQLAAALDSDLTGILYILDEPTIGLHPRDTAGMMTILKKLRDKGNTVIVIEHDPDVMAQADFIVDIGPGAGKHGGEIIGTGTLEELKRKESSVTGAYLKEMKPETAQKRKGNGEEIKISNATRNNLKHINVRFPLGCLISVTGVSGSGKSTLIFDVLVQANESGTENIVTGIRRFDRLVIIEQSPLTRMKRSNVATFSEVYTQIRKIFGGLEEARAKGLPAGDFSFNTPGGRCENCQGLGFVNSNLLFFKDIEIVCPVCGGKQFRDEILSVKYKGCSVKDVLQMSVDEAMVLFGSEKKALNILQLLSDVGLGYLELGQPLTTLSGGEGQRLKLARELVARNAGTTLYLMDEPTTGLHPVDVDHFLTLLNRLVDSGNTVVAVEHNQQVITGSDWIIDLGPQGGGQGGELMFAGSPAEMSNCKTSVTAQYMKSKW